MGIADEVFNVKGQRSKVNVTAKPSAHGGVHFDGVMSRLTCINVTFTNFGISVIYCTSMSNENNAKYKTLCFMVLKLIKVTYI